MAVAKGLASEQAEAMFCVIRNHSKRAGQRKATQMAGMALSCSCGGSFVKVARRIGTVSFVNSVVWLGMDAFGTEIGS